MQQVRELLITSLGTIFFTLYYIQYTVLKLITPFALSHIRICAYE